MVVTNTDLTRNQIVYERSNTWIAPDSGDTSGSRQTLVTGEACRRACEKVMEAKNASEHHSLDDLKGQVFYGEYLAKTDPLGCLLYTSPGNRPSSMPTRYTFGNSSPLAL